MAKQLIAAAHRKQLGAVLHGALQRFLLELAEVVVDERLLAVLSAAEKEDIDVVHPATGAAPQLHYARLESVPLRSLDQGEDVAAVAVDVHEVGIQPPDGELHVSQYGDAHPRLTSSARRSSIAVYVHSR